MAHYIQFTTKDGSTILVEAAEEETYQPGVVKAGLKEKTQEAVSQAKTSFEDGLEVIRHNADGFIEKVRGLSDPPDEVEVAFGLKATGELGNFAVAKAGAEASYTVTLTWKREEKKKQKKARGTSRRPQ
ncbi:MAG: CU044_2847 family protein [Chloroflexota bacterium]|nr:CU044_2847 family protein [Chloroflexota bacterium]